MKGVLITISIVILLLATLSTLGSNDIEPETGTIDIFFCPQDNCEQNLLNLLEQAEESIHCALFEVGLESVKNKLIEKSKAKKGDLLLIIGDHKHHIVNTALGQLRLFLGKKQKR